MMGRRVQRFLLGLVVLPVIFLIASAESACAAEPSSAWTNIVRILSLRDYNVRVVVFGTTLLGCAAGMVGSFTLLRKRALMGDALSHATLPGICLAFIITANMGGSGKSLLVLLAGATVTGLLGVGMILTMNRFTRLKEDTALGAVLSVFFGGGIALLGIVQQMKSGHAAGLESFIYGKTASMGMADIQLISIAALICIISALFLFKELKLLCFDDDFASSRGFPVLFLDIWLMVLVVIVTIVGLQAVGLILMVALLIIPAAAARFWTEKLGPMFFISGGIGALSGWLGAATSAIFSRLPSGAMIVLVCTAMFGISMIFGRKRGLVVRLNKRAKLNRSTRRQHLLRAMFELSEQSTTIDQDNAPETWPAVNIDDLVRKRSWSRNRLWKEIRYAQMDGLVTWVGDQVRLNKRGALEAARLTRQHRLWELFLVNYAEVAPARVDRSADDIEHVLEPEIVAELETILNQQQNIAIPESPHALHTEAESPTSPSSGGGAI